MPIEFYCPCGQRLHVPEAMAGREGKCPACGASLTVPANAAPVAPATLPVSPIAAPDPGPRATSRGTKPCPSCGGEILAAARKCKHCGTFLDPELRESRALQAASAAGPSGTPTDGMAIASLVLGILSIPTCLCSVGFFGVPNGICAALAIVFGAIARRGVRRTGRRGGGLAIAGLVTGSVGALLAITIFALSVLQAMAGPSVHRDRPGHHAEHDRFDWDD